MIRLHWAELLALFWSGMFVEAALGNWLGRTSRPESLPADALLIIAAILFARHSRRTAAERAE